MKGGNAIGQRIQQIAAKAKREVVAPLRDGDDQDPGDHWRNDTAWPNETEGAEEPEVLIEDVLPWDAPAEDGDKEAPLPSLAETSKGRQMKTRSSVPETVTHPVRTVGSLKDLEDAMAEPWRRSAPEPLAPLSAEAVPVVPYVDSGIMDRLYFKRTEGGKLALMPLTRAVEELRRNAALIKSREGNGTLYDIPVPGEAIFGCPRAIWQAKIFNHFIRNHRGDSVRLARVIEYCAFLPESEIPEFAVVCWKKLSQLSHEDFRLLLRYDLPYAVRGYLTALNIMGYLDKAYDFDQYIVVK